MSKFTNLGHGQAQIPMNLFATWEVDRSSPHCVPRTCSLALGKLTVIKELDKDVQSVFVAAKMQGSKRVLRSDEIFLSSNGLLNTQLELTFSLQYHHFIKRGGNTLQLMLQRKKRYKNRSMLGYKTLAVVTVDMGQILQCPIIETTVLDLMSTSKDRRNSMLVVAQAYIISLQSLPADHESIRSSSGKTNADRSPDVENYSDETFSSDPEMEYLESNRRKRKGRRSINRLSSSSRQQNFIKAKLVALLRRFKQDDEGLEPDLVENPSSSRHGDVDLDFLYDEIEDLNLSDSYPEGEDNISVMSTPKPKLRPFFDRISHSSSQTEISSLQNLHDQSYVGYLTNSLERRDKYSSHAIPAIDLSDGSDLEEEEEARKAAPSKKAERKSSDVTCRRKSNPMTKKSFSSNKLDGTSSNDEIESSNKQCVMTSQHTTVLPDVIRGDLLSATNNVDLPGSVLLIDHTDRNTWPLTQAIRNNISLVSPNIKHVIATDRQKHLSNVFTKISSLIQKFVSSNSNQPFRIKIAVAGSDAYISLFLRHFVDFLSSKSLEWQNYLLFLFIPCGHQTLSRYLSSVDRRYSKLFAHSSWWEALEKYPLSPTDGDNNMDTLSSIMINRINEYIDESSVTIPLTVAEAMITLRQNNESEESATQRFIPFIMEVIVGEVEGTSSATTDSDKDDMTTVAMGSATVTSSGVAMSSAIPYNVANMQSPQPSLNTTNSTTPSNEQKMGLQVDYWKEKDFTKYTLKSNFRSLHVCRLSNNQEMTPLQGLSLDVVTIGKKNIMRLPGKKGKEKDWESKSQVICPINRLICTSKHQHSLLKVNIDGVEWKDIKFFQLSSHWPSHAKTFPIGVFNST